MSQTIYESDNKITAIQNGEETKTSWKVKYKEVRDELWIHLTEGVTGYESIRYKKLKDITEKSNSPDQWIACYGGGGYDELIVPKKSLLQIIDVVEEYKQKWITQDKIYRFENEEEIKSYLDKHPEEGLARTIGIKDNGDRVFEVFKLSDGELERMEITQHKPSDILEDINNE